MTELTITPTQEMMLSLEIPTACNVLIGFEAGRKDIAVQVEGVDEAEWCLLSQFEIEICLKKVDAPHINIESGISVSRGKLSIGKDTVQWGGGFLSSSSAQSVQVETRNGLATLSLGKLAENTAKFTIKVPNIYTILMPQIFGLLQVTI